MKILKKQNYISNKTLRLLFLLTIIFSFNCFGQENGYYNSLESAISNPKEVKTLNLEKQKLKEFPKEILAFTNIERLILKRNNLKEIPKELSQLTKLHYLDLASNNIESLPKELSTLNLDTLILWDNRIREFDKEFETMSNKLKYLDLRAIQMNKQEQKNIKQIFPFTNIRLAHPCNCNR